MIHLYVVVGEVPREPVVVFDVDGVLVDCSERFKKSLEEVGARNVKELRGEQRRKFWEVFLSEKYMYLDKPNPDGVELARQLSTKYPIVVISGRPARLAEATVRQLREFGVPFTAVVFRADGYYGKDQEYKDHVVRALGLRVVEAHDDSEEVCSMYCKYTERVYIWRNLKPALFSPTSVSHNLEYNNS